MSDITIDFLLSLPIREILNQIYAHGESHQFPDHF
ncbi:hypothetical protein LCGC14_3055580, partial [marine sediment metagenome]